MKVKFGVKNAQFLLFAGRLKSGSFLPMRGRDIACHGEELKGRKEESGTESFQVTGIGGSADGFYIHVTVIPCRMW